MSEFAGFIHLVTPDDRPVRKWRTACGIWALNVDAHASQIELVTCPTCYVRAVPPYRSLADQSRNAGDQVPADNDSHQESSP